MADKSAFVLVTAMGHAFITNRFDFDPNDRVSGVGNDLLNTGQHEMEVGLIVARLAQDCLKHRGHGVTIIDGGCNMGHLSVFWGRLMDGASMNPWGRVISFEPQQWPYYAACGNIALNNCFNATIYNMALSCNAESLSMPVVHPLQPCNYGSVHLGRGGEGRAPAITIDSLVLDRLDILKLDVEGMEPLALAGAAETLDRCKPLIVAEHLICGHDNIMAKLPPGYDAVHGMGMNTLCVHKDTKLTGLQAAISEWKANSRAA